MPANRKLLIFTAIWCRPCQQLKPYLKDLEDFIECNIIDTDDDPALTQQYNIRGVPTIVLVEDDKELARTVGVQSASKIKDWINNVVTKH